MGGERRLLAVSAGVGILLFLAGMAVFLGGYHAIDVTVEGYVLRNASPRLDTWVVALTGLGNPPVALAMTAAMALFCLWRCGRREAAYAFTAVLSTMVLVSALKMLFGRERPGSAVLEVASHAFPSWHAAVAMALAATAAILMFRHARRATRFAPLLALWPLAIGFTRVYLRVHWLSDVVAGWGAGLAVPALMGLIWFSGGRRGDS